MTAACSPPPDRFATVAETCERFSISRATFYRMLSDRELGLDAIVVRVPPVTGRLRVPQRAFDEWLHARQGARR